MRSCSHLNMDRRQSARDWYLKTSLAYLGTPYLRGGDDPSGFDCSGFVVECLKSCGLLKETADHTANGLWKLYEEKAIQRPVRGALLFHLSSLGTATHVVICLDEYFQVGASGGSRRTVDCPTAWRDNAYVKIRPIRFDSQTMRVADPFL